MQTQSESGNDKATRTQDRKASINPQPLMPFDPFSATQHVTVYTGWTKKTGLFLGSVIFLNYYNKNKAKVTRQTPPVGS